MLTEEKFENIIVSNNKIRLISIFKEIIKYQELIYIFVKKDFKILYKQTILGPLLYIIQPIILAFTFTMVFNRIGELNTGGVPGFLYNLIGITFWNYFSTSFMANTETFQKAAQVYGKVYFPRIILIVSNFITYLIRFTIQLAVVILCIIFYRMKGYDVTIPFTAFYVIIPLLMLGLFSMGIGMITTTLISKYKDLVALLPLFVQFLMFISAVIYPISALDTKMSHYFWIIKYNPIAYVIETARCLMINNANIPYQGLMYSVVINILVFIIGFIVFQKKEKNYIDSI
jgi:lipopolysaccharide transport system permease protein